MLLFTIAIKIFNGQVAPIEYPNLVKKADSLFNIKDYSNSAIAFTNAFSAFEWKAFMGDRYKAACAWALAGNPDSAFYQLYYIADKQNYSYYTAISIDKSFTSLYSDIRWSPLITKVKSNKDKLEINLNHDLVAQLDTIYIDDQKFRNQLNDIEEKYGHLSKEANDLWKVIKVNDSINQIKVGIILDKYGWLGADVIGGQGSTTLFLVVQHSNLAFQKSYLPMLREAVRNGKARSSNLAMLEDRVAIGEGRKQIYGTQIQWDSITQLFYVSPLEDPINVDKRRAEIKLPPMAVYLKQWKLNWDAEQYIKDLPSIEERERARKKTN